jgi:Flp pilus assembly protein TadD
MKSRSSKRQYVLVVALASALVLAACGSPGGQGGSVRRLGPAQMLAQVRAAGETGRELDVQPLRDPQVEDLRANAAAAEQRGDFNGADAALLSALRISANDPDLLQWRAEMALVRRDWRNAETLALESYTRGPKLGGLCRRNWTTLQLAREALGDAGNAAIAQQRVGQCAVNPPVRM